MNKEIFWEGLENPAILEKINLQELESWKKEHPFFPLLSALICKKKGMSDQENIQYTASIFPSRTLLQKFLANRLSQPHFKPQILVETTQKKIEKSKNSAYYQIEDLYPEVQNQTESLENWLNNLKTKRRELLNQERKKEEKAIIFEEKPLTKVNTKNKNNEELDLISETLVSIYEIQEKFEKAKEGYELLIQKHPNKKDVYLQKIKDLELKKEKN